MNIFDGLKPPKVIYETKSQFNDIIQVVQVGEVIKIKVGGIDQSLNWESKACQRLVWGKIVDLLKRKNPDLNKVLVLGLGGGTIQHLLSQAFHGVAITSIEIDPVMIDVAKKFFDIDSIPNHKIIVGDAFRVVVEPVEYGLDEQSFDTIIVDIYMGERYPDLGSSGNFFSAIKKLVIPGGLVVFNRIYRKHHQMDVDTFIEIIGGLFSDVDSEIVAGYTNSDNILIYGRV